MIAWRIGRMFWLAASIAALVGSGGAARAVENGLSPWPKGYSGFMSGVLPPESGFYNQNTYYYFNASAGQAVRDGLVELNVDMAMNAGFLTGLYVSNVHFLGAQYAASATFTWAGANLTGAFQTPLGNASFRATNNTVGDSILTPMILGWHDGLFNWCLALNFYVPTGPFTLNRQVSPINLGRNVWGFMPQYSITYFSPKSGWDVSGSFVYVATSINPTTHYQSGDLLQLDWAVGKHFGEGGAWEVGVAGNVVEQVGPDNGSGAVLGPFKAQSIGVGPALNYTAKFGSAPVVLSAKWERDVQARNTFKDDVVNASATFVF